MIIARGIDHTYKLHWQNGCWLDEAGHRWTMDSKYNLHSKEHGFVPVSAWNIPLEKELEGLAL